LIPPTAPPSRERGYPIWVPEHWSLYSSDLPFSHECEGLTSREVQYPNTPNVEVSPARLTSSIEILLMIGAETTISPVSTEEDRRTSCNQQQNPSGKDKEIGEDISEFAHYAQSGIDS
jgi:hypothetical protein